MVLFYCLFVHVPGIHAATWADLWVCKLSVICGSATWAQQLFQRDAQTITPEALESIHKRAASLQSKPLPYSDLCEIVFQSIFANGDGQWTNTEIGASASTSEASASGPLASGASASGASAIRERVGALNMDDDPLVDVAVDVDDDDDDGNSRAHKINDEVRPKKKAKTSRVTMDDLMVDMQSALRHIVGTTDGPTTEQCYEKLKLVGLQSTDPVFLAAFNIFWAIKTNARGMDDIALGT
ncbi:hypothetical protein Tco_0359391 [Tanacetum coccineum]